MNISDSIYGGNVGLVLTQTINLMNLMQQGLKQFTRINNSMTSVERVLECTNVPQESALESTQGKLLLKNILFFFRLS